MLQSAPCHQLPPSWPPPPPPPRPRAPQSKQTHCQLEAHLHYGSLVSHAPEGEWARMAPFRILSVDIECQGRKVGRVAGGAPGGARGASVRHRCELRLPPCSGDAHSRAQPTITHPPTRSTCPPAHPAPPPRQGHFPEPEHDPVIQIASLVTEFGRAAPTVRNIMTLKDCAPITGAGAGAVGGCGCLGAGRRRAAAARPVPELRTCTCACCRQLFFSLYHPPTRPPTHPPPRLPAHPPPAQR